MVPEKLVQRWESAYRRYGSVSDAMTVTRQDDPDAQRAMAAASWDVAAAWRQVGATEGLPWWVLAAVEAAAEAFEVQAREWQERATRTEGLRWPEGR